MKKTLALALIALALPGCASVGVVAPHQELALPVDSMHGCPLIEPAGKTQQDKDNWLKKMVNDYEKCGFDNKTLSDFITRNFK